MYFEAFMKYDRGYHYDIEIGEDEVIFKEYDAEFSIVVAIDEFVRFFIMLDDFVINNDVIGHEDKYM